MWQLKWEEEFFKLTFSHIESERNKKKKTVMIGAVRYFA